MNGRLLSLLLASLLPALSSAQDARNYQCTHGGLERRVEIVSEAGMDVPCEVHYYKDTEMPGERQVLWTAQNEAGYCEARAREFIAELEGYGWDCGTGGAASPASEPETVEEAAPVSEPDVVDDTDALIPAGEAASTEGS